MINLKQITGYLGQRVTSLFNEIVAFMDAKYNDFILPVDESNLHIDKVLQNWREDRIEPSYQDLLKIKSEQNNLLDYLRIASNSEINKN
jgi:hypothetical protein